MLLAVKRVTSLVTSMAKSTKTIGKPIAQIGHRALLKLKKAIIGKNSRGNFVDAREK